MTPERQAAGQPTPALLFDTLNAYQRTEAIKSAIELGLFTRIGEGKLTANEIAQSCDASERGTRILCDYLVIIGFLTKQDGHYGMTSDSAMFLDQRSPAYMGSVIEFILSPMLTDNFKQLTAAVKKGGQPSEERSVVTPDNPIWVKFARAMAPMMALPSQLLAQLADPEANRKLRILDIAAGHGLFGLA